MSAAHSTPIETAASLLAAAHKSGRPIPLETFPVPATYAEVMAIQARTMDLLGERLGGWKISLTSTGAAVPAPMFTGSMHEGTAQHVLAPGRAIGFEAEIAVRLGADLPPRPRTEQRPTTFASAGSAYGAPLSTCPQRTHRR